MLEILATPAFSKAVKKLHGSEKRAVDRAVKVIAGDPTIGEEKKGDLAGVFVHEFKINKQEVLLAYRPHPNKHSPQSVLLLSMGSHENLR